MKKIFALMMVLSLAAIGCDDKKSTNTKPAEKPKTDKPDPPKGDAPPVKTDPPPVKTDPPPVKTDPPPVKTDPPKGDGPGLGGKEKNPPK